MKRYVIEITLKRGKKKYGTLYETKAEAERDMRGWQNVCGGKAPFAMQILELEKDEEK